MTLYKSTGMGMVTTLVVGTIVVGTFVVIMAIMAIDHFHHHQPEYGPAKYIIDLAEPNPNGCRSVSFMDEGILQNIPYSHGGRNPSVSTQVGVDYSDEALQPIIQSALESAKSQGTDRFEGQGYYLTKRLIPNLHDDGSCKSHLEIAVHRQPDFVWRVKD